MGVLAAHITDSFGMIADDHSASIHDSLRILVLYGISYFCGNVSLLDRLDILNFNGLFHLLSARFDPLYSLSEGLLLILLSSFRLDRHINISWSSSRCTVLIHL